MEVRLLIFIFFVRCLVFGQDTVKVEQSVYYSSQDFPYRSKNFVAQLNYAREDIVFSDGKKRMEFCYYYDHERFCFGDSYEILNDSILQIKSQFSDSLSSRWTYRMLDSNRYFVEQEYGVYKETGFVNTLIPFHKTGEFSVYLNESGDILFRKEYPKSSHKGAFTGRPTYYFQNTKIEGEIHSVSQLDKQPTLLNGDTLHKIELERTDYCLSEPMMAIRTISFIVTAEGKVKNIEQYEGNFDLSYCPFYFLNLMHELLKLGEWIPGIVNGKKVNTRYFIEIDMLNETSNKFAKHPALDHEIAKGKREKRVKRRK